MNIALTSFAFLFSAPCAGVMGFATPERSGAAS
jgi:hypothetical protein